MRRSTSSCAGKGRGGIARRLRRLRAGDDAAAEDARLAISRIVEHAGLSGRHAVFAANQLDFEISLSIPVQPSSLWWARRADLDVNFGVTLDRFADGNIAEPIDVAQLNATGPQRFARADHDPARRSIEAHDIERRGGSYAQATPLTHGKMNDAAMTAEC